jgi:hypothetical protein
MHVAQWKQGPADSTLALLEVRSCICPTAAIRGATLESPARPPGEIVGTPLVGSVAPRSCDLAEKPSGRRCTSAEPGATYESGVLLSM